MVGAARRRLPRVGLRREVRVQRTRGPHTHTQVTIRISPNYQDDHAPSVGVIGLAVPGFDDKSTLAVSPSLTSGTVLKQRARCSQRQISLRAERGRGVAPEPFHVSSALPGQISPDDGAPPSAASGEQRARGSGLWVWGFCGRTKVRSLPVRHSPDAPTELL